MDRNSIAASGQDQVPVIHGAGLAFDLVPGVGDFQRVAPAPVVNGAKARACLESGFYRASAFVRARLSPDGAYGLYLTIGAVVLTGAAWMFGGIAEDLITRDPLVQLDAFISEWLHVHASPRFAAGMHAVSALASTTAVTLLAIGGGCVLLWQRRWYALLGVVLAVPGGVLLNFMLKHVFGRARPGWADASLALDDPGFPSGHTMMAMITYGLLALYLVPVIASWRWRMLVAALAAVIILAVALSRMVLGAHYLSDVLGAMAAGLGWVALCLTAVETWRRRRSLTDARVDPPILRS